MGPPPYPHSSPNGRPDWVNGARRPPTTAAATGTASTKQTATAETEGVTSEHLLHRRIVYSTYTVNNFLNLINNLNTQVTTE